MSSKSARASGGGRRPAPVQSAPGGLGGVGTAAFALLFLSSLGMAPPARAITVDGVFSDWTSSQLIGIDAAGDVGAGDTVDFLSLWARFENSALYVSYKTQRNIDFAGNAWRYGVLLDINSVKTTGYRGAASEYALGADYLVEGATIYKYAGGGTNWAWTTVGTAAYAIAGDRLEMRIAGSTIGMTGTSKIKIMAVGKNDGTYDFACDDKAGFAYPRDPIVVDGAFTDWAAVTPVGTDATGDVSPGDIVDWLDLRALGQNGTLYLSYTTAKPVDLLNNGSRYDVLIDADNNDRSGYTNIPAGIGAEFLIEGATLFKYAGDGASWQWTPVTRVSAAAAANRLELAVAASHLGLSDTQFKFGCAFSETIRAPGTWLRISPPASATCGPVRERQ